MEWQLATAKNKLSELFRMALSEGPQRITRRKDAVVVMSEEYYETLTGQRAGLKDYLLASPAFDGVDLTRDNSPMRDVSL